nr:MAG TPA: Protein of unknown function (DUF3168) [Caudoviricetes sp.]
MKIGLLELFLKMNMKGSSMGKHKELRKSILELLHEVSPRVSFQKAKNTQYPYVIFDLERINIEEKSVYQLEINIYDNGDSTAVIEDLADDIEELLNRTVLNNEYHTINFYINKRNNLIEEDKDKKRIRLLIDLNYYGRS